MKKQKENTGIPADSMMLHDEVVFEELLRRTNRHFKRIIDGLDRTP